MCTGCIQWYINNNNHEQINKQNVHKQKLSAKPTNKATGCVPYENIWGLQKYSRIEGHIHPEGESSLSHPDLNTNWQSLAVFVFCFKIHALWLSNSRAAVLETAFFVHGNCCRLFQSTFPNFFSVKLGIYRCRQADDDVNNFVSTTLAI